MTLSSVSVLLGPVHRLHHAEVELPQHEVLQLPQSVRLPLRVVRLYTRHCLHRWEQAATAGILGSGEPDLASDS